MELAPGTLVTPNVRLVRLLREGGMGSVWVGEHLTLETQVAVKFILPELSKDDADLLARFRREAKVAARIKSQHVVQVFDHGVMADGTPFIVMELLEGNSLADWLALEGTLSLAETAEMMQQVASVLSKAHDSGIIHRDIKPENIFLVDSEARLFVKVLDFGIAKQTQLPQGSLKTGTGIVVGTPDFMSPEALLHAGEVDFRADLWALAVVAYRAITGLHPFLGETIPAIIVAITEGAFEPPSVLAPGPVPAAIDEWFIRALARDPQQRFGSARELADSFLQAAAGDIMAGPAAKRAAKSKADSSIAMGRTLRAGSADPAASPATVAEGRAARREPPPRRRPAAPPAKGTAVGAAPKRGENRPVARRAAEPPAPPKRRRQDPPNTAVGLGPAEAPRRAAARRSPAEDPASFEFALELAAAAAQQDRSEPPRQRPAAVATSVSPDEFMPSSNRDGPPSWSQSVTDDLALDEPARKTSARIRPAEAAMPVLRASGDVPSLPLLDLVKPAAAVTLAWAVAAVSADPGLLYVKRVLGSATYLGFGAATAGLLFACARTTTAARRGQSAALTWAAFALGGLAACSAVLTGALAAPASKLVGYGPWAAVVAPFAASAVALGFGAHGLLRARDELVSRSRARLSNGVVLLVMALVGIGIAYRLLQRTDLLRGLGG